MFSIIHQVTILCKETFLTTPIIVGRIRTSVVQIFIKEIFFQQTKGIVKVTLRKSNKSTGNENRIQNTQIILNCTYQWF